MDVLQTAEQIETSTVVDVLQILYTRKGCLTYDTIELMERTDNTIWNSCILPFILVAETSEDSKCDRIGETYG